MSLSNVLPEDTRTNCPFLIRRHACIHVATERGGRKHDDRKCSVGFESVAASASGPSSSRFGATRQPAWTPGPSPVRFLRESLAGGTWAEAPIRRWSHLRCRERLAPLSLLGEGGTAGGMRRSTAPPSWSGRSLAVDWPNCWALSAAAAALVLISAQCALGRRAIRPAFPGVPLPGCQRQRPTA